MNLAVLIYVDLYKLEISYERQQRVVRVRCMQQVVYQR